MRFALSALVLGALSATAVSQGLQSGLPKCAQDCFGNNVGSCSFADVACICKSDAITDIACCVLSTCNEADKKTLCSGSGVQLETNPKCPASGSASASSSASASASASSSASASGSAAASAASSSAAPISTGAAPFQSAGAGLGLGVAMVGLLAAL